MPLTEEQQRELSYRREIRELEDQARVHIQAIIELASLNQNDRKDAVRKGIMTGLMRSHPTTQQCFVSILADVLREYGQTHGDSRNAAAREWAKKATEDSFYFPYI